MISSRITVVANPVAEVAPPKPQASKPDGKYVTNPGQCPKLASRGVPTSVHDP